MKRCKVIIGAAGLSLAVGMAGSASVASAASTPSKATVRAITTNKMVPNRYIQDGLRWNHDVYRVRSGGTVTVINSAANEGPHTLTIVKPTDVPKTAAQVFNCKICNILGAAHGADPNSDAPPTFQFLENGTGQATAPDVDRPGDSGLTGPGRKGEKITMKVTAKKGAKLRFMCLLHPWMQARLDVG
ncbi:MAG: hypothetical protein QOG42_1128 [Solirubrobacteraceae bacterium]|nr:hypothetical protein [Solirubrobacteraceae bacterium]